MQIQSQILLILKSALSTIQAAFLKLSPGNMGEERIQESNPQEDRGLGATQVMSHLCK